MATGGRLPAATRSICPHCRAVLDAELHERDGRVFLRRECPEHGVIEALAYGDAERWRAVQRFDRPGAAPLLRQTAVELGCPSDCGICPEHAQHTCLGIIEVNTGCNLDCPICFAESGTGHQADGYSLSLVQVEAMLDAFVAAEGRPEAVQLSGGEPSIHPQILDMLAAARARGIALVMLNTNGIRLARDPRFAPALAGLGVHVYLQFDGFDDATHLAIRGRRLQEIKLAALDRCAAAGVGVSLAAAVERGINEHELGAIVRFGVEHPAVNGVFFQPVTHTGRHPAFDPLDRLTNVEVIRGVCEQLPEWFREDDFVAVPAARRRAALRPTRSMTERTSSRCRGSSTSTATSDSSPTAPSPTSRSRRRWRACSPPRPPAAPSGRRGGFECVACGVGLPAELQAIAARGFMVVAQDFQDAWTLDVGKLRKCCVAEIVPDGRLIPFCAYNSVGYREQVRGELA